MSDVQQVDTILSVHSMALVWRYSGVFTAFLNMSSRSGIIDISIVVVTCFVSGFHLNLNRGETLTLARVASLYPTNVRMVNQIRVIARVLRQ